MIHISKDSTTEHTRRGISAEQHQRQHVHDPGMFSYPTLFRPGISTDFSNTISHDFNAYCLGRGAALRTTSDGKCQRKAPRPTTRRSQTPSASMSTSMNNRPWQAPRRFWHCNRRSDPSSRGVWCPDIFLISYQIFWVFCGIDCRIMGRMRTF